MTVRIVPPPDSRLTDMSIQGCDFLSVHYDGVSGLYSCPLTDVLEIAVQSDNPRDRSVLTLYGTVLPRLHDRSAPPIFPLLEVSTYALTPDAAQAASIVPSGARRPGRGQSALAPAAPSIPEAAQPVPQQPTAAAPVTEGPAPVPPPVPDPDPQSPDPDPSAPEDTAPALVSEPMAHTRLLADAAALTGRVAGVLGQAHHARLRDAGGDIAALPAGFGGWQGVRGAGDRVPGVYPTVRQGRTDPLDAASFAPRQGVTRTPVPTPMAAARITWDGQFGELVLQGRASLTMLDLERRDLARLFYDPDAASAGQIVISLERNPLCALTFQPPRRADAIQSLEFDCAVLEVAVPANSTTSGPGCAAADDGRTLFCVIPNESEDLTLHTDLWGPVHLSPDEMTLNGPVDLGALVARDAAPRLALSAAVLDDLNRDPCPDFEVGVRFAGYCASAEAQSCLAGDPAPAIGPSGQFPSLADAGWTRGTPGHARLQVLVNGQVQADAVTRLTPADLAVLEAALIAARQSPVYPLQLQIDDSQYGNGRFLHVHEGPGCTGLPSLRIDLALRGLSQPSARACGSVRVYNDGRPVSACAPVTLSPDRVTLTTEVPRDACIRDRVVVAVVQNTTLNGGPSRAISAALSGLAAGLGHATDCLPVDVATTQGERREVLMRAEDLYFGPTEPSLVAIDAMSYVNPNSQILRDMGWIYRTWGPRMAGLILISDGAETVVGDITESPEALAWEVRGIPVTLIDPSGVVSCRTFEEFLFFDQCLPVTPETLESALLDAIQQTIRALTEVRDE